MGRNRDGTILNEKDHIDSHLNTLNDSTAKQKSDAPRESQVKGRSSKWISPPFSPTSKKTRKKSQSNKIDIWLNKTGKDKERKLSTKSSERLSEDRHETKNCNNKDKQIEYERNNCSAKSSSASTKETMTKEQECKSSTKSNDHSSTRNKDKREKENRNNENKQIQLERNLPTTPSSAAVKEIPPDSQTETNNNTKHNLKVTGQHNFKETSSNDSRPSRKMSERISKTAKLESQSHQKKLDTYLNNKDNKLESRDKKLRPSSPSNRTTKKEDGHKKSNNENRQNRHKDDNKKSQRSISCPSNNSTSSRTEDSHKESFNNNKEPTRKNNKSKTEVEKSLKKQEDLNASPDSSTKKKYKRIKSTAIKKDNVWLSKDGGNKDKRKDRSKTKYDKLPVKTSCNRSRGNFDEKNKSRKRSRSNTTSKGSVRNSLDEQGSLDKKYKSSTKRSRSKTGPDHGIRLPYRVQEKLDNYLIKNFKPNNKRKFTRNDSNESCELPSFKSSTKRAKKPKEDEFFKKYGTSIPSVEEILKDQRDLEKYKQKIQSFQEIDDKSFELPFSVKDLNRTQETQGDVLDCKHLLIDEITAGFEKNLKHISAIFHGETFNERHERYFNNTNNYALTVKDLCYNTSMIVFNFDQKEHMIKLLKKEFDPDDKWTPYFFQVLLPELCMKIFMDAHGMGYDEAVKYLDTRPIVDD